MNNKRIDIFETNSSSVHTISFVINDVAKNLVIPIKDNTLQIELKYYDGSKYEELHTPYEKIQYFLTSYICEKYYDLFFEDSLTALNLQLKKISYEINNKTCDYWLFEFFEWIHHFMKNDYKVNLYANEIIGIDHQSQYTILDNYKYDYQNIILNNNLFIKLDHD